MIHDITLPGLCNPPCAQGAAYRKRLQRIESSPQPSAMNQNGFGQVFNMARWGAADTDIAQPCYLSL